MADGKVLGAIELGGTKIVLAVGGSDGRVLQSVAVPTDHPDTVMPKVLDFFKDCGMPLSGIGVGAFGPIVIDPAAPNYGRLLETNKSGWSGFDLAGYLSTELRLPLALVTDVGAAAVGEAHLGALRDTRLGVYLTVGTGIGGAIILNGSVLPALLHPEMGHIRLQRGSDDTAPSACRFHPDCAEGLAAGPAIMARFGHSLSHFDQGGAEHRLIADYLGQLCANLVLTLSPDRIVIGGGVGKTPGLIPEISAAMIRHLGGYCVGLAERANFLTEPALGQDAGIVGALICAGLLQPALPFARIA